MIPVEASRYASHFAPYLADVPARSVRVHSKPSAIAFWRARFGPRSSRYFNLPQDAWIDSGTWLPVGNWDAALNAGGDAVEAFSVLLGAAVDWPDHLPVAYCISSTQIIETTWGLLRSIWPAFVETQCDCPLLVPISPAVAGVILFIEDGQTRAARSAGWPTEEDPMTLHEQHRQLHTALTRLTRPGLVQLPDHLQDSLPAIQWSARYATPTWKTLPLFQPDSIRECLSALDLQAPMYVVVSHVRRGAFSPVTVDFERAIDLIAQVTEPGVILVDARDEAVALSATEHHMLVLRGTVADWSTV
jgi:hypothetical protein